MDTKDIEASIKKEVLETLLKRIIESTRRNKLIWEEDVLSRSVLETYYYNKDGHKEPISVSLSLIFVGSGPDLVQSYRMRMYSKEREFDGYLDGTKYAILKKFGEEMFVD